MYKSPKEVAKDSYFQAIPFLQEWLSHVLFIGRVKDCPDEDTLILSRVGGTEAEISFIEKVLNLQFEVEKEPSIVVTASSRKEYTALLKKVHPRLSCGFTQYAILAGVFEDTVCKEVILLGVLGRDEWDHYTQGLRNYLQSLKEKKQYEGN